MKVITKTIHERLDNFLSQKEVTPEQELPTQSVDQSKKTIKKRTDGLIERLDNKIFIAEDNRQLLND